MNINVSSAQLRAARAMLKIKVSEVSKILRMGNSTIVRIENNDVIELHEAKISTIKRLVKFYYDLGIEFHSNNIVSLNINQNTLELESFSGKKIDCLKNNLVNN